MPPPGLLGRWRRGQGGAAGPPWRLVRGRRPLRRRSRPLAALSPPPYRRSRHGAALHSLLPRLPLALAPPLPEPQPHGAAPRPRRRCPPSSPSGASSSCAACPSPPPAGVPWSAVGLGGGAAQLACSPRRRRAGHGRPCALAGWGWCFGRHMFFFLPACVRP